LVAFGCLVGKPASLYATTGFLASNFYAGQRPKPLYRFLHQGNTYIGSSDRDYSIGSQTENSQLLHLTGNSTLVLLIGKAAFASYAFLCSSQARFCKWKFQAAICFKLAYSFRGALRFDRS